MKKVNGVLLEIKDDDIILLEENPTKFWNGVTSIGERAFSHCASLKNIEIPNTVTSIGDKAFRECKSLTNIKIPDSVTNIGADAFFECISLKNIEIPNTVTSINDWTFGYCKSFTDIKIPDSVTSIGAGVFYHCDSLTNIKIPDSVTSIGDNVFYHCDSLTNIKIPDSVTSIGGNAFGCCGSLTNIKISDNVTGFCCMAFRGCKSLKNLKIPNSVTSIDSCAFEHCANLTSIEIPNSVTSIGDRAFACCKSLTNIKIPDSVTNISNVSFFNVVQKLNFCKKNIYVELLNQEMLEIIKNNPKLNFKLLNSLYEFAKEQGFESGFNLRELVALSVNLGILEPKETVVETGKDKAGKPIMSAVNNIAYTFLQGIIKSKQIELNRLHQNLQAMQADSYNEAFMKFVVNKSNWSDIKNHLDVLSRVYDWFKARTELDLTQTNSPLMPTREEDRFKVLVYETAENGIDRMHWRAPTVENLIKEFAQQKFEKVNTPRDKVIAEELAKYGIYGQRHYEKAVEIANELFNSGVKNLVANPVKQGRIESLDQYRSEKQKLREQMLSDSAEILHDQIEDTSSVFTYELLSKSDPANFAMGCLTSCCATLYGAGAGAMRGMIIHPDMQPLVIRDFDNNIISFGIIYVNRQEGYAVVNNFEVNKKYDNIQQREAIYQKAMQGVNAFVKEYNQENPSRPIKKVTCGLSPNWDAINDFIRKNPKSKMLKAPNFDDFKYNGSGSWIGDWHYEQYEILKVEDEHVL